MQLSGKKKKKLLFLGDLFICLFVANSISLLVIGLFKLSVVSPDSVLAGCIFQEICPFPLGCSIYWHTTVHSILFYFKILLVVIYLLSFLLYLSTFFSLGESG